MSDPKRYGFPWLECDATDEAYMAENGMTELKDGGFVLWSDYEKLKAERIVPPIPPQGIPKLYSEVEFLDTMHEVIRIAAKRDTEEGSPCIRVTLTLIDTGVKP